VKIGSMTKSQWFGFAPAFLSAAGLITVVVPAFLYAYRLGGGQLASDSEQWAHLGEYFGGITGPLVALLALIAIAITINLQAAELAETRAEANRQRNAFDQQIFESTLFQLLSQFREMTRAVTFRSDRPQPYEGRDALFEMYKTLEAGYRSAKLYPQPLDRDLKIVSDLYRPLYESEQAALGPYFRCLYHVYKHIHQSARSDDEKAHYASIARAQLSAYEILMLFYNGTWGEGREFRALIQEYGILKHVPRDRLLRKEHMEYRDWYSVAGFQSYEDRKLRSPNPSSVNARLV
jgi:Putative phage abortive infection protein